MAATIGWRVREEDSLIATWDLPNGAEEIPMLKAEDWAKVRAIEEKWGPLCREIGAKNLLPDGWCQSMIKRESDGFARATRIERHGDGTPIVVNGRPLTGIGLLQITDPGLKGHRTDEELYDPRLNLEIGCRYISYLASRPDTRGKDGKPDFACVAAAFNAGGVHDSSANRWGMRCTGDHVDYEVRALNTWTYLKLEGQKIFAAQALAKNFNLQDTLESGHVTLRDEPTDEKTPVNT